MEIKYKYVKKGFSLFVKEQRESLLFLWLSGIADDTWQYVWESRQ